MAQVVCVGDLLIDFVPTVTGTGLVDAPAFLKAPGGAAANVAVGLARLGRRQRLRAAWWARIRSAISSPTRWPRPASTPAPCGSRPAARTALAFVSLRADGEREFMFYRHPSADMLFTPDAVDTAAIDAAQALHFDSISLASENPRASSLFAADQARAAGHLVTYDVNLRLPLWPERRGRQGRHPGRPRQGAGGQAQRRRARVHDRQPRARGRAQPVARRAASWSRSAAAAPARPGSPPRRQNDVATMKVAAVDTTGAGDGFMAGLIAGILAEPDAMADPARLDRICRFANAVGALTTTGARRDSCIADPRCRRDVPGRPMTAQIIPVAVFDLVVFGATGDLSFRKLMPALYWRESDQQMPEGSRIIGVARSQLTTRRLCRPGRGRLPPACRRQLRPGRVRAAGAAHHLRAARRRLQRALGGLGRRRWPAARTGRACSTSRPRPTCSARSAKVPVRPGSSRPRRAWCWKSRSAATSPRRSASTTRSAGCSTNRRSTGSTIISGRNRSRTCWPCASPTRCSRRSGTGPTSTMSRSPSPRPWASRSAPPTTTSPVPCATWCRTTSCSCSASSPWSRRPRWRPIRCATRSSRCCARCAPWPTARRCRRPCAASTGPVPAVAWPCPAMPRSWARPAEPRPSWRSRPRSRTGAGPARPSTCAPASGCRRGSRRS